MSLSAGDIVRLLKSDRDALRELAVAVASEPELRLAVINAVLADVATKQDINQLRQEMRGEITSTKQEIQQLRQELREEIAQLRQHVDSEIAQLRREMKDEISQLRRDMSTNFRWTIGLIIGIWGTTVIPLLMKMAGII
jgi:predicted  nucleic acid-binding Zn-ribbon protein